MAQSISDDAWIPLREAVPSFKERWADLVTRSSYDPTIPYANIDELVMHVLDLIQSDKHQDEQDEFFAALERSLSVETDDVREFLTIGIVEGFTDEVEERELDFRVIHERLAGPASREAWVRALAYTHPEMAWSDDNGLQRMHPLTPVVGRFRATHGQPLESRDGFLLEGMLEDGHAEPGNILRFRVTSGLHLQAPIAAVESPSEGASLTRLVLPHLNERSATYYEGIFWGLEHEPMDFEIALSEED